METMMAAASFVERQRLRRLSPRTVEFYEWGLKHLADHCPQLPECPRELLPVLAVPQLNRESQHDLDRVLRRFFGWAPEEYGVLNPTIGLERVPRKKTLPRVLSRSEILAVWDACLNSRDRGLVGLVLDTGVRVGEIAGMTKADLDPFGLRVDGKVGQRHVPVSPQVRDMLVRLGDGSNFWLGSRGGRLTYWGLKRAFRRVLLRAGLQGRKLGAHTLRHTFATEYCRGGGNVTALQAILGHQRLATTMIYVHLAGLAVAEDHAVYSPFNRLVTGGWGTGC